MQCHTSENDASICSDCFFLEKKSRLDARPFMHHVNKNSTANGWYRSCTLFLMANSTTNEELSMV